LGEQGGQGAVIQTARLFGTNQLGQQILI
jgi:hypothetical protein